jgi:UDP-N-acetylmuramoyl-L-alanyl-D-glutamate--2,6-diaminopimelate ligase
MAEAVALYSDEAIVTADNPRTERPEKILEEITRGIPLDFPHMVIADRREAIKKALTTATEGDCIVIAGKGHETYQEINGKRYHFDDREVVRELSKELKTGTQKQSSAGRERKP